VTFSDDEGTSNAEPAPATVLVRIDLEPPRQKRLSVFFRGVLCIPLAIVYFFLSIGVAVIVVLAWFAALVKGRVPDSFHRFLTKYERFSANLFAYEYLLVSKWPGVEYPRPNEQVSVEIPNVKQSRASIFFRSWLSIPASVLGAFWNFGHALIVLVMWVWILIRGRAPKTLHAYGALWLRYNIRLSSYSLLLTPEQPWHGMRGDGVAATGLTSVTNHVPTPLENSRDQESVDDSLATEQFASVEDESSVDDGSHWNVSSGARRLVNWSIPLGALLFVAYLGIIVAFTAGRISATVQVTNSYNATYSVEKVFAPAVTKCTTISCINAVSETALSGEVRADAYLTDNFARASSQYVVYGDDLDTLINDYSLMSHQTTITALRATLSSWQAEVIKTQTDVNALLRALA
jgi:Domain of unknown function (DUF4389)